MYQDHNYGSDIFQNLNKSILEERYIKIQNDHPDIDFDLLEQNKFIVVSFGSVSKVLRQF